MAPFQGAIDLGLCHPLVPRPCGASSPGAILCDAPAGLLRGCAACRWRTCSATGTCHAKAMRGLLRGCAACPLACMFCNRNWPFNSPAGASQRIAPGDEAPQGRGTGGDIDYGICALEGRRNCFNHASQSLSKYLSSILKPYLLKMSLISSAKATLLWCSF